MRTERVVSVLSAVLLCVLLSACGGAASGARSSAGDGHVRATILFMGDSNVSFALSPTAFALTQSDPAFAIVDIARAATTIRNPTNYWKVRTKDAFARVRPDGVVVNFGINDTVAPGTVDGKGYADYDSKIDWLMRLLSAKTPVWWTNLPCDIEPGDRVVGCHAINDALVRAPARWTNLTMLDFAAVARGRHGYLLQSGGRIHLSPTGGAAFASLVRDALVKRFPA